MKTFSLLLAAIAVAALTTVTPAIAADAATSSGVDRASFDPAVRASGRHCTTTSTAPGWGPHDLPARQGQDRRVRQSRHHPGPAAWPGRRRSATCRATRTRAIGDLYASFMDEAAIEKRGGAARRE